LANGNAIIGFIAAAAWPYNDIAAAAALAAALLLLPLPVLAWLLYNAIGDIIDDIAWAAAATL
jgi:hypothetical protein